MRRLDALERRVARVAGRHGVVPQIVVLDLHDWDPDDVDGFLEADADQQDDLLTKRHGGPLPEPLGNRPSVIIVVPGMEADVVDDDDNLIDKQATTEAIAERDRKLDVMRAELRREERSRLPVLERDENPDGDPDEVIYVEMPSGWPVTRREHLARLGALGG